ncbi:MAG: phosphopantothenoylcysteine decarboxylase, partial [Spirochaetes bacterium]|nr:phosphopantothenoylcysteine decarboxylase [Spirochaetota bacterium]
MRSNNIIKKIRNRKIIITAGGTIEPIDPVRYIGNHSSGKMGIALVKAFLKYSDKVILIHGRLTVPIPKNIVSIPAHTVQEMTAVLESQLSSDAVVIMAAAISDFKVKRISKHKIKTKRSFSIELVPTIDILKRLSSKKSK